MRIVDSPLIWSLQTESLKNDSYRLWRKNILESYVICCNFFFFFLILALWFAKNNIFDLIEGPNSRMSDTKKQPAWRHNCIGNDGMVIDMPAPLSVALAHSVKNLEIFCHSSITRKSLVNLHSIYTLSKPFIWTIWVFWLRSISPKWLDSGRVFLNISVCSI